VLYNLLALSDLNRKGKMKIGRGIGFFAAIDREAARAQREAERRAELQRRMKRRKKFEEESKQKGMQFRGRGL
jgi:hypothetical protein